MIARASDRVSFLRKFSRHFEGKESKAGLLSDISSATVELYRKNPELFHNLGKSLFGKFNEKRNERMTQSRQNGKVHEYAAR